jgi:shikimate 5-dehydrogenase
MTKPRTAPDREIYGLLGSEPDASRILKRWNAYFVEKGMDAFMDKYPTKESELPERLSEMFHFDRRAYIVGFSLQEAIKSHLDSLDSSVEKKGEGRVNVLRNRGGVLQGFFVSDFFDPEHVLAVIS